MARSEIAMKYGSQAVADSICSQKEADEEVAKTHIRTNPDMHGHDTPETCWHVCL